MNCGHTSYSMNETELCVYPGCENHINMRIIKDLYEPVMICNACSNFSEK